MQDLELCMEPGGQPVGETGDGPGGGGMGKDLRIRSFVESSNRTALMAVDAS
jgi:hypothetical protein